MTNQKKETTPDVKKINKKNKTRTHSPAPQAFTVLLMLRVKAVEAILLVNCSVAVSAPLKVMLSRICSPSTTGTRHPHSITFHVGYALHSQAARQQLT